MEKKGDLHLKGAVIPSLDEVLEAMGLEQWEDGPEVATLLAQKEDDKSSGDNS